MAVTSEVSNSHVVNVAVGRYTDDAVEVVKGVIETGFKARHIRLINMTQRKTIEWFEGMGTNILLTLEEGTASMSEDPDFLVDEGGFEFGISIAFFTQDDDLRFIAIG